LALIFTDPDVQINFRLNYCVQPVKRMATKRGFDVKYRQLEDRRSGFVLPPPKLLMKGENSNTCVKIMKLTLPRATLKKGD
jgi:hypothetical protein